jgi:hypothetical protein
MAIAEDIGYDAIGSPNARKYCSVLKTRLKAEGSQLATNCSQLKMQSADGKYYNKRK